MGVQDNACVRDCDGFWYLFALAEEPQHLWPTTWFILFDFVYDQKVGQMFVQDRLFRLEFPQNSEKRKGILERFVQSRTSERRLDESSRYRGRRTPKHAWRLGPKPLASCSNFLSEFCVKWPPFLGWDNLKRVAKFFKIYTSLNLLKHFPSQ